MSSCSYILLKSEFDRLRQNDPDFQKLLAIYEPGKPKNKSEYGFMMDMLTLQSATKNDKMMRKKSRIAAQYNGTYTKNEPITDRLAKVEDLIEKMEKAGCGYGLRAYAAQQKLKQQPTTKKSTQPAIDDCLQQALSLIKDYKGIAFYISKFSINNMFGQGEIQLDLLPAWTANAKVSLTFNITDITEGHTFDAEADIDPSMPQEDKMILRLAYIFGKTYQMMCGRGQQYKPPFKLEINYNCF